MNSTSIDKKKMQQLKIQENFFNFIRDSYKVSKYYS